MWNRLLLSLSIACGVVYFVTLPWQPYPASFAIKGLSIGALALMAFNARKPLLGIALSISALGDVLLDLDPERLFVFGLGSFLVAHLVYITLFLRSRRSRPLPGSTESTGAILVFLFVVSVGLWLIPSLGNLAVPVALYMCAITTMVLSAILARFSNHWVAVGGVLFLISDTLLAINKFKQPVPYHDFLIWGTYYAGQYGIAVGFVRHMQTLAQQRS